MQQFEQSSRVLSEKVNLKKSPIVRFSSYNITEMTKFRIRRTNLCLPGQEELEEGSVTMKGQHEGDVCVSRIGLYPGCSNYIQLHKYTQGETFQMHWTTVNSSILKFCYSHTTHKHWGTVDEGHKTSSLNLPENQKLFQKIKSGCKFQCIKPLAQFSTFTIMLSHFNGPKSKTISYFYRVF